MLEFRNLLQDHHYTGNSVKNPCGKVSGFFTNNNAELKLGSNFWSKARRDSKLVEDFKEKSRLIDNAEIRLIIDLSDNETALATLLWCQNGMLPDDLTDLTYEKIGFDPGEKRDFTFLLLEEKFL